MKNLFFILLSLGLLVSGCAEKSYNSFSPISSEDDNFGDDDDVIVDPDDDDDDGVVVCPRYDLVVISSDTITASRNYKFVFNSEMKQTTTQGKIDVTFNKDSSTVHYIQCSGAVTNTTVLPSFKPLDATEDITKQIAIYPGRSCTTQIAQKQETIRVIDSANGEILFDEEEFRAKVGACAFGYTADGEVLREQILQFARGVVDNAASSCHK